MSAVPKAGLNISVLDVQGDLARDHHVVTVSLRAGLSPIYSYHRNIMHDL